MSRKTKGRPIRVRPYSDGMDFDIDVSTLGIGFSLVQHRSQISLGDVGRGNNLCIVCDGTGQESGEDGRVVLHGDRRSVMREMRDRGYWV